MEMFHYEFMQRAFWAGTYIAILGPILGVFLMLRRQAMLPDTLAHVSLAGIAFGISMKWNPEWTALASALLGALILEWLRKSYKSYSEVSVAIMMTGGLSVAVLLMSMQQALNKGFTSYLFGSIVAVSNHAIVLMSIVTVCAVTLIWWMRRPLYLMTFDEDCARTSGVNVSLLSLFFNVLAGFVVSTMLPIIGVLLVSALVILPAALATRIGRTFGQTILIAIAIGIFGVYSGLSVSYAYNTPSGATIAFVLLCLLICGLISKNGWRAFHKNRYRREHSESIQPTVSVPQPVQSER